MSFAEDVHRQVEQMRSKGHTPRVIIDTTGTVQEVLHSTPSTLVFKGKFQKLIGTRFVNTEMVPFVILVDPAS